MDGGDAAEAERRQRALDGLPLRVEDACLGPDQYTRAHQSRLGASEPVGEVSPVMRSYASTYFARVRATTSSGISGAGGVLSQPVEDAQSRTNCLSKLGWPWPGSYRSAGQKRDESGVQTSSPSVSGRPESRPNSNFVSARMIPRSRACSAAYL